MIKYGTPMRTCELRSFCVSPFDNLNRSSSCVRACVRVCMRIYIYIYIYIYT